MITREFQLAQINQIAGELLKTKQSKVYCFYGEMGAGKTTLIKAMVKSLGSPTEVSSPTFGLVNEYHSKAGHVLAYHFDFYRINNEEEAMDIGFEEYLATDAFIFIEWPELIPNLLPDHANIVRLDFLDEQSRSIQF